MHSLLESYLSEVATQLSVLPENQCREELREMRTHLENAVIVSRELGQSEEEAAQGIVAQFGTPRDLGDNLVWAWRRERTLNKRSLVGAVITSLVGMCLLVFVAPSGAAYTLDPILALMERTYHWSGVEYGTFSLLIRDFPMYLLIGAGSGRFFPRRAVQGTSLVVGAWAAYPVIHRLCWGDFVYWPGKLRYAYFTAPTPLTLEDALGMFVYCITPALVAVASASVISRWRMKRAVRVRLMRD